MLFPPFRRRIRGILLLEALVYMSVLAIIMASMAMAYLAVSDGTFAVSKHAAFLLSVEHFRQKLAAEVGRCRDVLIEHAEWETSEKCLILEMPDGRVRVWRCGEKGVVAFDAAAPGVRDPEDVLRDGQVRFDLRQRKGQLAGATVEVSLPRLKVLASGRAFSTLLRFSVFKEGQQ